MYDVVLSNGFGKFHLSVLASELTKSGLDVLLLTGAYVPDHVGRMLVASPPTKLRRLGRRAESTAPRSVRSFWTPELLNQLALQARERASAPQIAESIDLASFRSYGRRSAKILRPLPGQPRIFHYRAGFGGGALQVAKDRGMTLLCDHSIAHPIDVAESLGLSQLSPVWRYIRNDIEAGDHVVVNSDYVKRTFIERGWCHNRISVQYWGIDNQFLGFLEEAAQATSARGGATPRLLFAGSFEPRKGADILLDALAHMTTEIELLIAGPVPPSLRGRLQSAVKTDSRLRVLGLVDRRRLAELMLMSDAFVFPSRSEGSARVVFEAMAAGLPVVTTANSGSVVRHGEGGTIVPAGDSTALAGAINHIASLRPGERAAIGHRNGTLVRASYRQEHYASGILNLYERLSR